MKKALIEIDEKIDTLISKRDKDCYKYIKKYKNKKEEDLFAAEE